ncbi:hypothetical protein [Burkholderia sola]|uniref:hypothetical protein n=1 Tax=Burkholderia sola TaxID=2843302 RepID=UPI00338FAB01
MEPLQVIQNLEVLTKAIEDAVARVDWSEAVRAAEVRSRFVIALAPDQPDEVRAAIGRMQETDIRIFAVARETFDTLIAEGGIARCGIPPGTQALAAKSLLPGADAMASRNRTFPV